MSRAPTLATSFAILAIAGCASAAAPVARRDAPAGATQQGWAGGTQVPIKPFTKISPELLAIYEAYRDAKQRGIAFRPQSPTVRIVDERVVIDATAERDARQLQADLSALGMQQGAAFGRVVSGQLPIAAIPQLETLESLASARTSASTSRPIGSPSMPRQQ